MKIFLKYISKCMLEKKSRLILLIIAISLSTGMFVSSVGAVKVGMDSFTKPYLAEFENQEIVISSKDKHKQFIDKKDIKLDGIKELKQEIRLSAVDKNKDSDSDTKYLTVHAREKKNINEKNIIDGNIKDFSGNDCVISKRVSEENKLKINDKVKMYIGGKEKEYTIKAISSNEGIFFSDKKDSYSVVVPYETIAKEYSAEGKYNFITAKAKDNNVKDSIKTFNKNNKDFNAEQLFDEESINEQMSSFTSVLYIMLLIVVFMSAIIIFGSFKLIVTERLQVIGTFLSQGATKGKIEKILFLESLGYGIIGGIVGNLLGVAGLKLINYLVSPLKEYGIIEKMHINPNYLISGMIFAIVLSFVSAIIPVKKIRKMQVKDIILNEVSVSSDIGYGKFIVGLVLVVLSIIVNSIKSDSVNVISGPFVIISVVGIILMYPKLIDLISSALFSVFKGKSKAAILSLNNLRTSKVLRSNITLIIISLLSIFMMSSVSSSLQDAVTGAYKEMKYDLCVSGISQSPTNMGDETVTDKIIEEVKKNKHVKNNELQSIRTMGKIKNKDYVVEGIDDKYDSFNKYLKFNSEYKDEYKRLINSKDDSMIISTTAAKSLNLKNGDYVNLDIDGTSKKLKVAGIINERLYSSGNVVFIKNSTMRNDFKMKEATGIYFFTDEDPEKVKKSLNKELKKYGVLLTTGAEDEKLNNEANQQMLTILSIFSYMAILIAAIGIFNNISIGFLQRKKEIAVLKSIGMSKGKVAEMIVVESILSVVWAAVISVIYMPLGLSLISKLLIVIGMPLEITMNYSSVPQYFIASIVIILIATIPALLNNRKLSIIQEIRYE